MLPSLNLVFDFENRNILRFAAAKTMMRGRIDDEKAASSASVAATGPAIWSGSGGNPGLKPYIAIGEDLSFEKIFGKASYFSVALFNKNLTSYIFTQTDYAYDFTGYKSSTRQPISNIGQFSLPANGSGGRIQGYELALTLEAGLLTPFLDGFGLQSNFAYTNNFVPTNILGNVPGGPTTFPGFSRKSARSRCTMKSTALPCGSPERIVRPSRARSSAISTSSATRRSRPTRPLTFRRGNEFQDGRAKGPSVLLQINNLKIRLTGRSRSRACRPAVFYYSSGIRYLK